MIISSVLFRIDYLSLFIGVFIIFFSFLTFLYSLGFMKRKSGVGRYYTYIILTLISSLGVVFSNNLVLFMVFWGFLGLLLYVLIHFGDKERTPSTAKKAFIIVGGTDAFMLLGVALIWHLTHSFDMDRIRIVLDNPLAVWAYLFLAIGAFAKAGAMPFHTWVPDTAEDAPTPVTAFLPASLDKLLGIYFLFRISVDLFVMNQAMNIFLLVVGSFTIIAAVMMALVQHDFKRLLGYHAVSQVGYMVLGIGTGNPLGIAGGLFHMLNHAIYKSCLFFSAGAVEQKTGTTHLDHLGGLGKMMPLTFLTFFIASLAISGVPPANGFVSKWMIYQGVIETGKNGSSLWVVWLIAAMFGSALTLASFMKLIHAIFLGHPSVEIQNRRPSIQEVRWSMALPMLTLALLCILFGVFAYQIPLSIYILPCLKETVAFTGLWDASLATIFILLGIFIGFVIYLLGLSARSRPSETFIGGEDLQKFSDMRVSGTDFYKTIQDVGGLNKIYRLAENKVFDIYEGSKVLVFRCNWVLKYLHNGILPTYLAWCLLGMIILFYLFLL